jgi:hypothetical protein
MNRPVQFRGKPITLLSAQPSSGSQFGSGKDPCFQAAQCWLVRSILAEIPRRETNVGWAQTRQPTAQLRFNVNASCQHENILTARIWVEQTIVSEISLTEETVLFHLWL